MPRQRGAFLLVLLQPGKGGPGVRPAGLLSRGRGPAAAAWPRPQRGLRRFVAVVAAQVFSYLRRDSHASLLRRGDAAASPLGRGRGIPAQLVGSRVWKQRPDHVLLEASA